MAKHIEKVVLNSAGTITLHFIERDGYSWRIVKRWQVSVPLREFEHKLRDAQVTVPWREASR